MTTETQSTRAGDGIPEGWALIPLESSDALLRPFYECPSEELKLAWQAMHMIAAKMHPAPAAAPAAAPAEAAMGDWEMGDWQQYAKEGETAQACIERHRGEHDSLLTLLAQARAALAAAPAAAPAWQPIETAPMDGRKLILFYLNRNGKARTVMARWVTDEEAAETDADGVGLEGGWYECIDNWDEYSQVTITEGEPSYWQPLPAAPEISCAVTQHGKGQP